MSLEAVQRIIARATTDPEFRQAITDNPDGVFTDRDVTPQEIAALRTMDWGAVSSLGEDVDVRGYLMQYGMPQILASCK